MEPTPTKKSLTHLEWIRKKFSFVQRPLSIAAKPGSRVFYLPALNLKFANKILPIIHFILFQGEYYETCLASSK